MKIFFDTEFTGLHQDTTLISIGLVDENGRSFYGEFTDYDIDQVDEWIHENVIKNLTIQNDASLKKYITQGESIESENKNEKKIAGRTHAIRDALTDWLAEYDNIEMWSDCLAYDWVLFNNIWGGAFDIPKQIYYIPFDICTMMKLQGVDPDISREEYAYGGDPLVKGEKHNSLFDAHTIRACYENLRLTK